jgi:dTDP-4-dehydrorhamnose 3,5-epimerase
MRFEASTIAGVVLVRADVHADERGSFARTWDRDEFAAHGLNGRVVQRNLSYNHAAATLRGLHFQRSPHAEAKLVSCLAGALFDVAVDLRPESPTFREWIGVELRAVSGTLLYIGEGCAHGFITLEPDTAVEYLMSELFHADSASGVRWNDPAFRIQWPCEPRVISERDRAWPDFATPGMTGTSGGAVEYVRVYGDTLRDR